MIHSKAFDGLKGDFPIGFWVWKTNMISSKNYDFIEIMTDVLDKQSTPIGSHTFSAVPSKMLLSNWISRPRANKIEVVPLKNAVIPASATKDLRGTRWADDAIGCLIVKGPDVQNARTQALVSSGYGSAGSIFVTTKNVWQIAVVFAVRKLVKATWLNDRDMFLQPAMPLTDEFKNDCLVWMLFSGSNLTASANGLNWNGKDWSIVNHFIPFTEAEVGAPDPFESDFMVQYLDGKILSTEAQAVLAEAKKLWRSYFDHTNSRNLRDELKLNRPDVGWYQVRKALDTRNSSGDFLPVSFLPFQQVYKTLTEKLQPLVYDLGFLKP